MKIRTKNELKDSLDKDFAWRIQELSQILHLVKTEKDKTLNLTLRTATLLLYAHWEGFVKNGAATYLNYVSHQDLEYKNLIDCFVALSLKQKLIQLQNTNKATIHTQFVKYFRACSENTAPISDSNVITTGSNLNSSVLREILTTIGIDYSPFDLKANLIDEQLLNYRNTIAHGEFLKIDQKEYIILHREVFNMMSEIKNAIENAVALNSFKIIYIY